MTKYRLLKALCAASIFIFCGEAVAKNGQVSLKAGSWSYDVQSENNESASTSGFGAYAAEIGYSFFDPILYTFGFNLILSDIISGSSGYGIDLGARYYLLGSTGTSHSKSANVDIFSQDLWRPYVGLAMRQRIFGLAISTSYIGPGLTLGLDYSMGRNWFLNFEARYDQLYGDGDTTATQTNFLLGAGIEF